MHNNQKGTTSAVGLAIIAIIISVLALLLAWAAYDRAGVDLDEQIRQEVNSAIDDAQDGANEATERIDEGPDGVDEDDTDTPQ